MQPGGLDFIEMKPMGDSEALLLNFWDGFIVPGASLFGLLEIPVFLFGESNSLQISRFEALTPLDELLGLTFSEPGVIGATDIFGVLFLLLASE